MPQQCFLIWPPERQLDSVAAVKLLKRAGLSHSDAQMVIDDLVDITSTGLEHNIREPIMRPVTLPDPGDQRVFVRDMFATGVVAIFGDEEAK